ncbi:MAG TPA: hypothetical protein DDZ76_04645 [Xanthomonadales bacterium]|nr:hypothetical protein [Xanthomonadales bacterium]
MVKTYKTPSGEVHVDRRIGKERRQSSDRREEFRFEPGKENRRSGKDRRKANRWDDSHSR